MSHSNLCNAYTPAGLLTLYITNEKKMGQCQVSIQHYIIIYYTVMNAKITPCYIVLYYYYIFTGCVFWSYNVLVIWPFFYLNIYTLYITI